jgi:hypothetical protein
MQTVTLTTNKFSKMAKYSLLVNGTGFDGSAHTLTSEEVQKIQEFKEEAGYNGLDEMYSDLPELLENYDHFDTNYWVISTAMFTPRLHFVLVDENEEIVWDVKPEELSGVNDEVIGFTFPEDAEDRTKEIDGYPHEGKENILLVYEETKGTMIDFVVETDEVPKPTDFSFSIQSLETPEYELELIDKVFFKGSQLESVHEHESYTGKGLTVEIFTLDDLDNDDDWDEDEEE